MADKPIHQCFFRIFQSIFSAYDKFSAVSLCKSQRGAAEKSIKRFLQLLLKKDIQKTLLNVKRGQVIDYKDIYKNLLLVGLNI